MDCGLSKSARPWCGYPYRRKPDARTVQRYRRRQAPVMEHTLDTSSERARLQAWYLNRLSPKLAAAVNSGKANAAAAAALDVHVRQLLGMHHDETHAEAA